MKINLYLNDAEKEYVEQVKKYIQEHFTDINNCCQIHYLNMPASDLLNQLCVLLNQTEKNERNFIFIDPYGYKYIPASNEKRENRDFAFFAYIFYAPF